MEPSSHGTAGRGGRAGLGGAGQKWDGVAFLEHDKAFSIPGHALHEKGLQIQIGDGTLVSNQERRALAVPVINRG